MGLTDSRKFIEILNLSEQKNSYNTIKDLEIELNFPQTEIDNCTPSGISIIRMSLL